MPFVSSSTRPAVRPCRRSLRLPAFALVVAVAGPFAGAAAQAQPATSAWPMFHGDPGRTGRSSAPSLAAPIVRWVFQAGDTIYQTSPALGPDGAVYFGSNDGKLYAVNANGSLRWTFQTGGPLKFSGPAVAVDGTVYIGSMDSSVYAVNANGTLRWSARRGSTFRSSPLILPDGDVVIGNGDNNLYRFTAAGAPVWSYSTSGNVRSSAARGPAGDLYVGSHDFMVHAVSDAGVPQWTGVTGDIIDLASPAVGSDSTIYIGSEDQFLYAVRPDGTLRWAYTDTSKVDATPCIRPDGVIVAAMGSHIEAIEPTTGTYLWDYHARSSVRSSPVCAADGTVYFGSDDSTLYAVNADGTLRFAFPAGAPVRSSPAIGADGTVYFGAWNGKLFALGTPLVAADNAVMENSWLAPFIPSPAGDRTHLRFAAPLGRTIEVSVFDAAGRRVATPYRDVGTGAEVALAWNLRDARGRRVAPGVYHVRWSDGVAHASRPLVVLP